FLPDKAIDLMDEAASRIRMEVESKPEEIENLDRRIIQLKIEREALKKEQDKASNDRLAKLEEELANLEQQSAELTQRWQAEKEKISAEAKLKEQLDSARLELEQAQRAGDLAKAGELQYGRIPELEKQLAEAQAAAKGAMLREEVTDQDIAAAVSRWTGVPVEMMMVILAVGEAELGDGKAAGDWIQRNLVGFLKPPFNVRTETVANNAGYILATSAGFVQSFVYGLSGLRIEDKGLIAAYP